MGQVIGNVPGDEADRILEQGFAVLVGEIHDRVARHGQFADRDFAVVIGQLDLAFDHLGALVRQGDQREGQEVPQDGRAEPDEILARDVIAQVIAGKVRDLQEARAETGPPDIQIGRAVEGLDQLPAQQRTPRIHGINDAGFHIGTDHGPLPRQSENPRPEGPAGGKGINPSASASGRYRAAHRGGPTRPGLPRRSDRRPCSHSRDNHGRALRAGAPSCGHGPDGHGHRAWR